MSLTTHTILTSNLLAQQLSQSLCKTAADVVEHLGAIQAQDYLGALWSVGLRAPGLTEASIEQELAAGTVIRTWPMRGTLHFVAPKNVRWMLKLLAPRVISRAAGNYRQEGLDQQIFDRCMSLTVKGLEGGKCLTRDELYQLFSTNKINIEGQRGMHIIVYMAHRGLICFGARKGKQQTFVLLDEWVKPSPELEKEEALEKLAVLYFDGHGAATVNDLAWWSGLTQTEAKLAVALTGKKLSREKLGDTIYYASADAVAPAKASPKALLLPGFDEYLTGSKDRKDLIYNSRHVYKAPANGLLPPKILVNGEVAGTWKRVIGTKEVVVELNFNTPGKNHERLLRDPLNRYAEFLGMPLKPEIKS